MKDMTKILTEAEMNHLVSFAENETQYSAIHKTVLATLQDERNTFVRKMMTSMANFTNEDIGQRLRAFADAMRLVEAAFREISQFKKEELKDNRVHPGR